MAYPSLEPRGSLDGSDSWTEVDELPRTPEEMPMPAFRSRTAIAARPSRRDSAIQVAMDLPGQSGDSGGEGQSLGRMTETSLSGSDGEQGSAMSVEADDGGRRGDSRRMSPIQEENPPDPWRDDDPWSRGRALLHVDADRRRSGVYGDNDSGLEEHGRSFWANWADRRWDVNYQHWNENYEEQSVTSNEERQSSWSDWSTDSSESNSNWSWWSHCDPAQRG